MTRNTWAWGLPGADAIPQIHAVPEVPMGTRLLAEHVAYGPPTLSATGRELDQARDETFCAVAGHNQHGNPNTAT